MNSKVKFVSTVLVSSLSMTVFAKELKSETSETSSSLESSEFLTEQNTEQDLWSTQVLPDLPEEDFKLIELSDFEIQSFARAASSGGC